MPLCLCSGAHRPAISYLFIVKGTAKLKFSRMLTHPWDGWDDFLSLCSINPLHPCDLPHHFIHLLSSHHYFPYIHLPTPLPIHPSSIHPHFLTIFPFLLFFFPCSPPLFYLTSLLNICFLWSTVYKIHAPSLPVGLRLGLKKA